MRFVPVLAAACLLAVMLIAQPTGATTGCQFLSAPGATPAFCDTFSASSSGSPRDDALAPVWGVSRTIGSAINPGQHDFNGWNQGPLTMCDGSQPVVVPPHDVTVCDGQVREEVNDTNSLTPDENGDITSWAMYPKQPFDFAGRTGTISFDVSNDHPAPHAYWPELWITDKPSPDPFIHGIPGWDAVPQNAFAIRFSANTDAGQTLSAGNVCPSGDGKRHWTVFSAGIVRNYQITDSEFGSAQLVNDLDCVVAPDLPGSGPAQVNHVEVRLSQNQADVYATDASPPGQYGPIKHIATIPNLNLSFTRGLVWLEDVHYNSTKAGNGATNQHTFAWGNVAFDGPKISQDLAFDAPDAHDGTDSAGRTNLGYYTQANQPATVQVPNVSGMQNASGGLLTFDQINTCCDGGDPSSLSVTVNGHPYTADVLPVDSAVGNWHTFGVPINLSDVQAGTNTVTFQSPFQMVVANVDLIMIGAGGGGSAAVTPTSTGVPPTSTSVPPTATPMSPTTGITPAELGTMGDGVVNGVTEQCDDGNIVSGDGCSSTGQVEPGKACTGEPSICGDVVYVGGSGSSDPYHCTGGTDDAAINQALGFVHSHAGYVGVRIRTGVVCQIVSDSLLLYNNESLDGEPGAGLRMADHAGWPQYKPIVGAAESPPRNLTLASLDIDGNRANQGISQAGFYNGLIVNNVTGLTVHDVTIRSNNGDGFKVEPGTNLHFWHNTCFDIGHDCYYILEHSANVRIHDDPRLSTGTNSGVRLVEVSNANVYRETVHGIAHSCVQIQGSGSVEVRDLTCYDAVNGIGAGAYGTHASSDLQLWAHHNLIYNSRSSDPLPGAPAGRTSGIACNGFYCNLEQNTIYNITTGPGIGTMDTVQSGTTVGSGYTVQARDNIVTDSLRGVDNVNSGQNNLNVSYGCFWNNSSDFGNVTPGSGNVIADPLFANAPADFHLKSAGGRYQGGSWVTDAATSPCIDKGDPSAPFDLEPQPNGGRANIGRYGDSAEASKSLSGVSPTSTPTPALPTPSPTTALTATPVPATATTVPPTTIPTSTATVVPATATPPPTKTPLPPTATPSPTRHVPPACRMHPDLPPCRAPQEGT